ncbi:hypothetical protein N9602_05895 [Saprospiraceae bacterium]|nr:hypothetical protein [Saprospiraceae bacterium]
MKHSLTLLLLLSIPLVSFGQANLGQTKDYLINECELDEECQVYENTDSLISFKYGDAFNEVDGQTEKNSLDINGYCISELLTIHNTEWKSMSKFDRLLSKSPNWKKIVNVKDFLLSENLTLKYNSNFSPSIKAKITYYKVANEIVIEYTYGKFKK